jgi:hypothetical protein
MVGGHGEITEVLKANAGYVSNDSLRTGIARRARHGWCEQRMRGDGVP